MADCYIPARWIGKRVCGGPVTLVDERAAITRSREGVLWFVRPRQLGEDALFLAMLPAKKAGGTVSAVTRPDVCFLHSRTVNGGRGWRHRIAAVRVRRRHASAERDQSFYDSASALRHSSGMPTRVHQRTNDRAFIAPCRERSL